jgi:hypothetical protein
MFSLRTLTAAASFAALAAAPLAASALQVTPPVAVTSCQADVQAISPITAYAPNPWQGGNVRLSFVNTTPVTATNVELLLAYNGTEERIDTAGTFSPGIQIARDAAIAPYVSANDVTCSVAKVQFSDGTSWSALAAAPKTTAQR